MSHYLNNAGASLMSQATLSSVVNHLTLETQVGGYKAASIRDSQVEKFYDMAAKLIAAPSSSSIAFMDSASRAWNMALYGLPIRSGDEIRPAGRDRCSHRPRCLWGLVMGFFCPAGWDAFRYDGGVGFFGAA